MLLTKTRILSGTVFSDLGQGARFMSLDWVQQVLRDKLGFAPYPATLNLRLAPGDVGTWETIRSENRGFGIEPPSESFCDARCFPVVIEALGGATDVSGAILYPEIEGYPPDKIEIVAPVHVKGSIGVRDGDQLVVKFN